MRRRDVLIGLGGGAVLPGLAHAGPTALEFAIWRGGERIGSHSVRITREAESGAAEIAAELVVKIGPVTVFRHQHHASEGWSNDRLMALDARTVSNGAGVTVSARGEAGGLVILRDGAGRRVAPPETAALTHWNPGSLSRPLFNPETGATMRVQVARTAGDRAPTSDGRGIPATRYALTGDANIVDWYDEVGNWCGLRTRAPDGSTIEYRRL